MAEQHTEHHIVSPGVYLGIFLTLMVLTATTIFVAFVDLGMLNNFVAMTIAVTKGMLVILYFMHVRYSSKLIWIVVGGSFFWIGILFVLTIGDYVTRGWLVYPNRAPFFH